VDLCECAGSATSSGQSALSSPSMLGTFLPPFFKLGRARQDSPFKVLPRTALYPNLETHGTTPVLWTADFFFFSWSSGRPPLSPILFHPLFFRICCAMVSARAVNLTRAFKPPQPFFSQVVQNFVFISFSPPRPGFSTKFRSLPSRTVTLSSFSPKKTR